MTKYKVAYIGNIAEIAEMIAYNNYLDLIGIICEQDRVNDDIITMSLVRDVALYSVIDKDMLVKELSELKKTADFFIMYSFGLIIPINQLGSIEIYNIHSSLLPYYKGRHPTYWATINNEKFIGISIHKVSDRIDEGDIIAQEVVPYYFWMNESELFDKLTWQVPHLLDNLIKFKQNKRKIINNSSGNYYPMVSEKDKIIELDKDNYCTIFNKIRVQSKYGGAKICFENGVSVRVKKAKFTIIYKCNHGYYEEGEVLFIHIKNNVWLKATDYYKEIDECE